MKGVEIALDSPVSNSNMSDDDLLILTENEEVAQGDNREQVKSSGVEERCDTDYDSKLRRISKQQRRAALRQFNRPRRPQQQHSITEQYYGQSGDYSNDSRYDTAALDMDLEQPYHNAKPLSSTHQSRRLPPWAWRAICTLLGVPIQAAPVGNTPTTCTARCTQKPWIGSIMQAITIINAVIFSVLHMCYTAYDIKSAYTKQTLLMGCVNIVIALYWCSLGVYARSRAAALFKCRRFAASVRVHSKTIFRISSAGILLLFATTLIVLNNVDSAHTFHISTCHNVSLPGPFCHVMYVSRVMFSVWALLWNMMVAVLLLSVCRTHTIGIRRFIQELESDGFTYELLQRHNHMVSLATGAGGMDNITEVCTVDGGDEDDYVWDDDMSPAMNEGNVFSHPQQQHASVSSQQGPTTSTPGSQLREGGGVARQSRKRRSTLSLPASTYDGGSTRPTSLSDYQQAMQHGEVSGSDPTTVNTQGTLNGNRPKVSDNTSVPDIEIGDNVMQDYTPPVLATTATASQQQQPHSNIGGDAMHGRRKSSSLQDVSGMTPQQSPSVAMANHHGRLPGGGILSGVSGAADNSSFGASFGGMMTSTDELTASLPSGPQTDGQTYISPAMVLKHETEGGVPAVDMGGGAPVTGTPEWRRYPSGMRQRAVSSEAGLGDGVSLNEVSLSDVQILTNNNILLSYWKISCRLRTTSLVLQRWLVAVIFLIFLWDVTYLIHWISHSVTLIQIIEFILPLLLLPIVCSAYAEVNMEGRRMVTCICPMNGRVQMLYYLLQQPLEITTFGFPINYSTIVKAMGAMILAFCTRLILDEVGM